MYNVVTFNHEHSCFTCDTPTRHYVIEFEEWLCLECIKTLSAIELAAEPWTARLDRHANN